MFRCFDINNLKSCQNKISADCVFENCKKYNNWFYVDLEKNEQNVELTSLHKLFKFLIVSGEKSAKSARRPNKRKLFEKIFLALVFENRTTTGRKRQHLGLGGKVSTIATWEVMRGKPEVDTTCFHVTSWTNTPHSFLVRMRGRASHATLISRGEWMGRRDVHVHTHTNRERHRCTNTQ